MKLNRTQKWIAAPVLAALALGSTATWMAQAQPPAGGAAKGEKKAREGKGQKKQQGGKRTPMLNAKVLAVVLGKPLTAEQEQAIADAAKTYNDSVAKAVGLTPDELAAKVKEYRAAQRAEGKAGKADGAKKAK